jgi:hypothetical protein
MSHQHYCGVEGHEWQCSDPTCECICGELMESAADHRECAIELRDCPEHQGQLPESSDGELSSGLFTDLPSHAEKLRCECGCAVANRAEVVGHCVWCKHVYVRYTSKTEAEHFLHHCSGAPAELHQAAQLKLGRLD